VDGRHRGRLTRSASRRRSDGAELRADEAAGRAALEFIEILPFTPANRNNLIGWIAGRSDEPTLRHGVVYDFPKTSWSTAAADRGAHRSERAAVGQLSLWNQQGSHVRRGGLIVIPVGRALLYAEPIYLQAERSPMPELRIVVLALQDRLAYGPTFEARWRRCSGGRRRRWRHGTTARRHRRTTVRGPRAPRHRARTAAIGARMTLIPGAARDLADYQRLTAEGKLGGGGAKLEALKLSWRN
jgi:uncharacterized membrane protein (UPF0182 family)